MPEEPTFTQENRRLRVETPLGEDVLLLTSFTGREELSRLFCYELDFLSEHHSIDPRDILGQPVSIHMEFGDQERRFHGVVSRFTAGSVRQQDLRHYHAELAPWLWLLTRNENCRVFQNQTVPDIIEQILNERGFNDYELALHESHAELEYCVQYRESDFNFLSRLIEEEGIFYAFRHDAERHTLILTDSNDASQFWEEVTVPYAEGSAISASVRSWEHRYEYTSGKWAQTDYNFQKPANGCARPSEILLTQENSLISLHGNEKYEVFDFPAEYQDKSVGRARTRVRMQAEEVAHDVIVGSSTCPAFNPLAKFTLRDHDCTTEDQTCILTSVQHSATEPAHFTGGTDASIYYSNSFTCIPASVAYRPERASRKPIIEGPQTAVVTGPPGEEIWTDEFGRVTVQFFWDRIGQRNDKSSCWVRCAQSVAGKRWGSMFIPRVGQEVVVTFLEGDPDRPLITGVVYNAEQMPPYELPTERTKSYVKTNSSSGGDGYNEIRFEDKQEEEQIFLHAQRDMDVRVRGDCKERVLGNRHLIVGGDGAGDQKERVHGNKHLKVEGVQEEHIVGSNALTVGSQSTVIKGFKGELVHGDEHLHTQGNHIQKVDENFGVIVRNSHFDRASARQISADDFIHIKAGQGCYINIQAGQIILKAPAGGNFIQIDDSGIKIQGSAVEINCGASAAPVPAIAPPPDPLDATESAPEEPAEADDSVTGQKSAPDSLT